MISAAMGDATEHGRDWLNGWPKRTIFALAALAALLAAGGMLGCLTQRSPLVLTDASGAAMKFTTALSLLMCSLALVLLAARRRAWVPWFSAVPLAFAVLTLIEYLTGWNFHLDELFVTNFVSSAATPAGRMGPLSAGCIVLFVAALFTAVRPRVRPWHFALIVILTVVVMTTAALALLGYYLGIQVTSGWGAYTRMAAHTAVTLLLLGSALMVWVRRVSRSQDYDVLVWIPVTGAVTLMTMTAVISLAMGSQLRQAMGWRKHSGEVIAAGQNLEDNYLVLQRSVRAYVSMGATDALMQYQEATNTLPQYFASVSRLTGDNPAQTARVTELADALKAVLEYDQFILNVYREKGSEAVFVFDKNGTNRLVTGRVFDDIKAFNDHEQSLLAERDAVEQRYYDNVGRLLTFGSVFAAALLVLAHILASREMGRRRAVEKTLRESEELFRSLVTGVKDYAIYMLDVEGRVASWNSGAQKIKGYTADEIVGQHFSKFFTPADVASRHPWNILATAWREGSYEERGWRVRKDGSLFMANVSIAAVRNHHGVLQGFSKIIRDVTEPTRVEAQLRESEERFRRSFDDAPIGMALVSPTGRWLRVNHALCEMLGYQEHELLNLDFQSITHPEDLLKDISYVQQVLTGKMPSYQLEKRYYHKLGHVVFVLLSVSLVRDRATEPLYFVSQIENISERKRASEQMEASLREKDALLREIHHRVKNNMQVISSILKLQTNYIRDPAALEVFNECQSRIRTMALVHEKLYRTEGLAQINFKDYLSSLAGMLFRAQAGKTAQVEHHFEMDDVELDADTAIPLGLVANELITNCLKHAFAGRQKGFVMIGLRRYDASQCQLIVKDDGQGLGENFSLDQTRSLGMRLVRILTEQIRGRLEYKNDHGAEFVVTFRNRVT